MTPEHCASCEKQTLVDDFLPASIPVHQCQACQRMHFDAAVLERRRAETPRRSERRMFGLSSAWLACLLCDCLLAAPPSVTHVRCYRCGEEYERRSPARIAAPDTVLRELFELVKLRPDDDATRERFADALLERGEVRGEFIRLQLEEARSGPDFARAHRINELLQTDAWRWTPPGVYAERCEFHRGFLSRAHWPHGTDPNHDGWATVTTLDARPGHRHSGPRVDSPLGGPLLQTLERISRCGEVLVSWLVEAPPPKLRSLGMSVAHEEMSASLALRIEGALAALTSLDELDVATDAPFRWNDSIVERAGRRLKTLWLPIPLEAPRSLLGRVRDGLTLKLATLETKERARSVITISNGRVDVSVAAGEAPDVVERVRRTARIISEPR